MRRTSLVIAVWVAAWSCVGCRGPLGPTGIRSGGGGPPTGVPCVVTVQQFDTVETLRDVRVRRVTEEWVELESAGGRTWIPRRHVLRVQVPSE